MKKYLPIIASLLVVAGVAFVVINKKNSQRTESKIEEKFTIGNFNKQRSCAKHPEFLKQLKVTQPITIDLSQQQFKGLAFLYGQNFSKVIHPKVWETFEHFSTYSLDEVGNVYLAPMPFISIKPTTFNLQKNIYKLDSKTGKLEIFMNFDDVHPSASNPYGIISLVYDCDDQTLWVSAIDESDYREQKGVIYHVDVKTKSILQRVEGFDALTITLLKSEKGKFLLAGSARDNALYAYDIENFKLSKNRKKILELLTVGEYIRKIKVRGQNLLELQTIPFSYTLIAETSENNERNYYSAKWDDVSSNWSLRKK
jgi:hypothetical protein